MIHLYRAFSMGSDEGLSYDYVFNLELLDLGPFIVVGQELLPDKLLFGDNLLTFFLCQVQVSGHLIVLL